jgi:spore germination protein KC
MSKRARKRMCWIVSITCSSLLLSGCWDRTELNDLSLVKAIAIDKTKNNKVNVAAELFLSTHTSQGMAGGGGGGGGAGGAQEKFVQTATGLDVADATTKLQEKLSRKIFWGHDKAFIIGESLAKSGIQNVLDFIVRGVGIRERTYVFVSEGDAKKILDVTPPLERNEAEVLRKMAESKIVMGVTILDLWKMAESEGRAAAIPMIRLSKPVNPQGDKNNEGIAYISKVAILKNLRMVGAVDDRTARGIQWLKNEVKTPIITVHPKGSKGLVAFHILHARTRLEPSIRNGTYTILVKGETKDDIIQNTTNLDTMSPVIIKKLEGEMAQQIERRMYQALDQIQKGMKADIFGFGAAFHRKYPKEWEKMSDHWDEIYPKVKVQIAIDAHILRPGVVTSPAGVPEKEVRKK